MHNFIRNFERDEAGSWTCIHPATLDLPTGRIQITPGIRLTRGSLFMGVDLAKLLDEQTAKEES